jgi:hypothetical protein
LSPSELELNAFALDFPQALLLDQPSLDEGGVAESAERHGVAQSFDCCALLLRPQSAPSF